MSEPHRMKFMRTLLCPKCGAELSNVNVRLNRQTQMVEASGRCAQGCSVSISWKAGTAPPNLSQTFVPGHSLARRDG